MKNPAFPPKSSHPVSSGQEEKVVHIYQYLNQGNLYRIYQLLDSTSGKEEKRLLEELFVKRFGFNYRSFI